MSRLNELLKEKRMLKGTDTEDNKLNGLYKLIQKYTNPNFTVVEIGSYAGASSELFAINCKSIIYI